MQVFKFGGASVKDAESVRNSARIISKYKGDALLVVISAMGKTTNLLEKLTKEYFNNTGNQFQTLEEAKAFHFQILQELFPEAEHPIFDEISNCFVEIEWILEEAPQDSYDYLFDQIVSMGEFISTKIVAAYVAFIGEKVKWLDARDYIFTDNTYREAVVDWNKTEEKIRAELPAILDEYIVITQGFLGSTSENFTTTLGREGSDYSAAIFASCLNAENVTIWKDVPGVLNADPKWFEKTELIPELCYRAYLLWGYGYSPENNQAASE